MVVSASWKRGFMKLGTFSCIVGLFFPFIVWTPLVKFQVGMIKYKQK